MHYYGTLNFFVLFCYFFKMLRVLCVKHWLSVAWSYIGVVSLLTLIKTALQLPSAQNKYSYLKLISNERRLNKVNSRKYQLTTATQQVWLWFTLSILTLFAANAQNVEPWMIFIVFLTHQARYDKCWHISRHYVTSQPVSDFVSSPPLSPCARGY